MALGNWGRRTVSSGLPQAAKQHLPQETKTNKHQHWTCLVHKALRTCWLLSFPPAGARATEQTETDLAFFFPHKNFLYLIVNVFFTEGSHKMIELMIPTATWWSVLHAASVKPTFPTEWASILILSKTPMLFLVCWRLSWRWKLHPWEPSCVVEMSIQVLL